MLLFAEWLRYSIYVHIVQRNHFGKEALLIRKAKL